MHETQLEVLQKHERPFEVAFKPGTPSFGGIAQALDRAKPRDRVLVLGMHGGMAENGELQVMCEMRGVAYIGSGSASSYLAFDKNNGQTLRGHCRISRPRRPWRWRTSRRPSTGMAG